MLTEQQLKNLEPLCSTPKYGKILENAIEIWKQENVTPLTNWFGIDNINGLVWELSKIRSGSSYCCCLLGASLVGKSVNVDFYDTLTEKFNISETEIIGLFSGFDTNSNNEFKDVLKYISDDRKEAFIFGYSVHRAVFENTLLPEPLTLQLPKS